MNNRIKQIRVQNGETQQSFAEKLNITRNYVCLLENRDRAPSDRTIDDICRIYNVNRKWLETGEGEMYRSLERDREIATFFGALVSGDSDERNDLKRKIVQLLAKMTPEQWEALAGIAESWAELNKNERQD